jgi:hypothetical protein
MGSFRKMRTGRMQNKGGPAGEEKGGPGIVDQSSPYFTLSPKAISGDSNTVRMNGTLRSTLSKPITSNTE